MKRMYADISTMLIVSVLAISCGSGFSSSTNTPQDLCKSAVDAIKTKNYDNYIKLLRNADDLAWMQKSIIGDLEKSGDKEMADTLKGSQQMETDQFKQQYEQQKDLVRKKVLDVHTKAVAAGIDWPSATVQDANATQSNDDMTVKVSTLSCNIKSKNNLFAVNLNTVYKVKRGWVLSEPPAWAGKVKP